MFEVIFLSGNPKSASVVCGGIVTFDTLAEAMIEFLNPSSSLPVVMLVGPEVELVRGNATVQELNVWHDEFDGVAMFDQVAA